MRPSRRGDVTEAEDKGRSKGGGRGEGEVQ